MSHKKYKKRKSGGLFGGLFKLLLLVLIIGGIGFAVYKFTPDVMSGKFNSSERFNLVVTAPNKTALVSLDSTSGKATVVTFPPDLYVNRVAHGYGQYPIGKVYDVGQLDKRGGEVLSDTVAFYLGLPVDGYIRLADFSVNNPKQLFMNPAFFTQNDTDINLWDKILLAKAFSAVRFDKMSFIDLSKKSEPLLLADGSTAKIVIEEDLDNLLDGYFAEQALLREDLRIQVVNTTELPGLGASVARVISGLGATVIDVTTEDTEVANCEVSVSKPLSTSKTVRRIGKLFGCEVKISDDLGRADVIVLLGTKQGELFAN